LNLYLVKRDSVLNAARLPVPPRGHFPSTILYQKLSPTSYSRLHTLIGTGKIIGR